VERGRAGQFIDEKDGHNLAEKVRGLASAAAQAGRGRPEIGPGFEFGQREPGRRLSVDCSPASGRDARRRLDAKPESSVSEAVRGKRAGARPSFVGAPRAVADPEATSTEERAVRGTNVSEEI